MREAAWGYYRRIQVEQTQPPAWLQPLAPWDVVVSEGAAPVLGPSVRPLASWEALHLSLVLRGTGDAEVPGVVCARSPALTARKAEWVGIDGSVLTAEPVAPPEPVLEALRAAEPDEAATTAARSPTYDRLDELLERGQLEQLRAFVGAPVRLAIVDTDFHKQEITRRPVVPCWINVSDLSLPEAMPPHHANDALGHGARVADVIGHVLRPELATVTLYDVLARGDSARRGQMWTAAIHIAIALLRAAAEGATVILCAMSDPNWGCPAFLDVVLRRLADPRHAAPARLVVWSASMANGQAVITDPPQQERWAIAADEIAAHPSVFTVGACDWQGAWYRRALTSQLHSQHPLSRLAPSVAVVSVGEYLIGKEGRFVDDTSGASALVAAVAAWVTAMNPHLQGDELGLLLRLTATQPETVDESHGPLGALFNAIDRTGFNPKTGNGAVAPLRACLAARDPICLAFALASPGRYAHLAARRSLVCAEDLLARLWFRKVHEVPLAGWMRWSAPYAASAPALVVVLLRDRLAREAWLWCVRHWIAIAQTEHAARAWSLSDDHSAFVRRVQHALAVTRAALSALKNPALERSTEDTLVALHDLLAREEGGRFGRVLTNIFSFVDGVPD